MLVAPHEELDFATNFAADGIGEWRNSGSLAMILQNGWHRFEGGLERGLS